MRINDDDIKAIKVITTQLENEDPTEKKGKLTLTDDLKAPVEYNDNRRDAGLSQFPKVEPAIENKTPINLFPQMFVRTPIDNTYVKHPIVLPVTTKKN